MADKKNIKKWLTEDKKITESWFQDNGIPDFMVDVVADYINEHKLKPSDGNQPNSKPANCAIFDVSKRYRFTMQDVDTNEIIIIDEDTERKAFRKAFRFLGEKKLKDRELSIVSKVDNVC